MQYLIDRFDFVNSMGIYNCRPIAGKTSLSTHSCGRAGDAGIPMFPDGSARTELGFQVVRFLDEYSTPLGITEQIYNRVKYDRLTPRGRYYGGVHPHRDHDHWGQALSYAQSLTYAKIVTICGPAGSAPTPTPPSIPSGEYEMTAAEFASKLSQEQVKAICAQAGEGGVWVISPTSNDRVGVTNYFLSILSQPSNPDWVGFYVEVQTEALVNATIRKA